MYDFNKIVDRQGTHAYKLELRKKIFGNPDVLPMWVADMDFETEPEIADAIKCRAEHAVMGYTIRGEWFQQSIVNWMSKRHQWRVETGWVEYAPGVVPSIVMAILAFTNPGDKILIQTPVYPPFFSVVKENNRELVCNSLVESKTGHIIDYDLLEKQLSDPLLKLFVLCHPHNPVGRLWSKDELQRMGELCLKHDVMIVSDEIHSDLVLFGHKHIPMASISSEIAKITITLMAPSKTFNIAGLATSYVIISNKKLMAAYRQILTSWHLFTGNVFGGIALAAAYEHGEPWLEELIKYLEGNVRAVQNFIADKMPEVKMVIPDATFLLWLDFRFLGMNQSELKDLIFNKAMVGLNDGSSFGVEGHGFMRMNVGCRQSIVNEALMRIYGAMIK